MKALILFSGGLDSQLAIKLVTLQNIEVVAININHGFSKDNSKWLKSCCNDLGVEFVQLNNTHDFIQNTLFNSKFGYGKYFNPCLDCHMNFIQLVWNYGLKNYGLNNFFIVTGEVLGQRGMSQTSNQLNRLKKAIPEIIDYVVRPISAKLLPITIPEKLNWIDRNKLLSIVGRNRKEQLKLIEKYNIKEYESPGGGCFLIDEVFSKRLKKFNETLNFKTKYINLIRFGRHFYINDKLLIVSRNEEETLFLENFKDTNFEYIDTTNLQGPLGIIMNCGLETKKIACKILSKYSKITNGSELYEFEIDKDKIVIDVPFTIEEINYYK